MNGFYLLFTIYQDESPRAVSGTDILVCPIPRDRQQCLSYRKSPAPNNAGLSKKAYSISLHGKDSPSCLADCFSWPQVALTHHVSSESY